MLKEIVDIEVAIILSVFVELFVLARQDYFELIPNRLNILQPVRGLLGIWKVLLIYLPTRP